MGFVTRGLTKLNLRPRCPDNPALLQLSGVRRLRAPVRTGLLKPIRPLRLMRTLRPAPTITKIPATTTYTRVRRCRRFSQKLCTTPLN